MKQNDYFERVDTLLVGECYMLRHSPYHKSILVFTLVCFVGHTSCPATVIVQDARNNRFPCERGTLYRLNNE